MKVCLIRRSRTSLGFLFDFEISIFFFVFWRYNKIIYILFKLFILFGCYNVIRSIFNIEDFKGYNVLYMFFIWLCINYFRVFGGKLFNMLN